jgi:hypothetical protein
MSKNRDNTKEYAQLHGLVSEMHHLENRLYEMLEAWDFRNSNDYWRLADQFHDLNMQFSKSVGKNIRIDRLNLSFGLMHESMLTTDVPLVKVSNAGETSFIRPLIFDLIWSNFDKKLADAS